jgi:hypothetical protein
MNETTPAVEDNRYDQLLSDIEVMTSAERKDFLEKLWDAMDRETRVEFTMDAMDSFARDNTLDTFLSEVNHNSKDQQV